MKNKVNWKVLVLSFIVVAFTAFLGSIFTSDAVNSSWYQSIKPSITPPNFVFPIVWTALFILIALALYFTRTKAKKEEKNTVDIIFFCNLFLNAAWSFFYFGMKNPLFSFFEIILLFISTIIMINICLKIDRKSAYMLIPYLAWVAFAMILNSMSV